MNDDSIGEILDGLRVIGVNTGVLGVVTFGDLESVMNIILLSLTCVWTIIKIKKLIKK
jgi:hypothetical protein